MVDGNDSTFDEWAILELMGHRRLAGKVTEQEIGGANMIRIDVYRAKPESTLVEGEIKDVPVVTQFYSSAAVYCITPTTEEIARQLGENSQPAPVSRYELAAPRHSHIEDEYQDD